MAIHSLESVERTRAALAAAVAAAENTPGCRVHIGRGNGKTAAVNEGTTPLVTCSARACATCGRECYAVWHIDGVYPAARKNHAENTVARRRDPIGYYERFFAAAVADGVKLVRVNETGDFEGLEQLRALIAVAARYPRIVVIGYTRRPELIDELAQAPANVHIRYSLYRDGDESAETVRRCNCACVSAIDTTCPAQIAAANGRRWTCADCAKYGAGCASARAVVIFRAH